MSKSNKKITIYCFVILLLCFLQPLNLNAQDAHRQNKIKVGIYNNPPKIFINDSGHPDGFFVDILKYIAENENLNIEYVSGEWHQLTSMLKNGEIDVLPDMAYSIQRDSIFAFNKLFVLSSWLDVFTINDRNIHTIMDLDNKNIGVLKGSVQENYMNNVVKNDFDINYTVSSGCIPKML